VALVRTDVSEERMASIVILTKIGELGMTLTVTNNRSTLRRNTQFLVTTNVFPSPPIFATIMIEVKGSSETSFPTRAKQLGTPEDGILHSYGCENIKFYNYF
jgi:hypothetical protein